MLQPIQTKPLSAEGYQWNQYSPRVATITNELTHFARVAYFHFPDWNSAHAFWKTITDGKRCTRAQVREAERFNTGWEVKAWGMPEPLLLKLIERDRNKQKVAPMPRIRRDWSMSASHSAIAYEAA